MSRRPTAEITRLNKVPAQRYVDTTVGKLTPAERAQWLRHSPLAKDTDEVMVLRPVQRKKVRA